MRKCTFSDKWKISTRFFCGYEKFVYFCLTHKKEMDVLHLWVLFENGYSSF